MSPSLGVKAKANKLNSSRINWRYRLSIGIRLFFRFNIVASKEYRLTIIVRRLFIDTLLLVAPIVL